MVVLFVMMPNIVVSNNKLLIFMNIKMNYKLICHKNNFLVLLLAIMIRKQADHCLPTISVKRKGHTVCVIHCVLIPQGRLLYIINKVNCLCS